MVGSSFTTKRANSRESRWNRWNGAAKGALGLEFVDGDHVGAGFEGSDALSAHPTRRAGHQDPFHRASVGATIGPSSLVWPGVSADRGAA